MKKAIIYLTMALLLVIAATAQTMVREISSSVNPGATFNVRYQAQDASGNFGVLIDDSISGGCAPNSITTGFLGPATYADISVTAPSSGTCTFTGNYQFADASGAQPEKTFQPQSVSITSASSSCTSSTWSPSRSDKCIGTSFTQTSNCGTTRSSTGTKVCDTGSAGDTSKGSGSGLIFIIVAVGLVLFFIAVKE